MRFLSLLLGVFISFSTQAKLTYEEIQTALKSPEGLVAEVHGADKDSHLFVIVVRNPQNFFDYLQIPLVADYTSSDYEKINAYFYKLNRHDFVRVKGDLHGWIDAAQRHILVKSIETVKKFDGGYADYPDYKHKVELPKDLKDKTSAVVKVHAVLKGGHIFVVEYKDTNLSVVVQNSDLVKDLYRGDKIEIKYTIAGFPKKPTHLVLKDVTMLDRLVEQHDKPISHCGELVMFPKSPQVKFNVFAIKKDIGDDLFRTYTLINFDDMDLFLAVRQKAQDAWDVNKSTIVRGRNYYVNPDLIACANGTVNMIDQTQANPQIVITNINDLYFP